MAAKSFASRFRGSRRFLSGFVAGAVVGAAGAGLTALQFLRSQGAEAALAVREPEGSSEKALLEQFGFPLTGTEVMQTENTVNSSLIPTSLQPSVPSTRTILEVGGHEDTWLLQEITNSHLKPWLKPFTFLILYLRILIIMLDIGTE
ncbi:exo/endonuclease G [Rhinolophus ferrumequinum]|uniref:Exo/endonuclease G n=1 Tax=Rhinolophus ferrumequinum TaxID=59479 RepID=A0A7J7UJ22_RHIFE|nr:exo/endonuclease G [Rhinolophus ferrumequinum]